MTIASIESTLACEPTSPQEGIVHSEQLQALLKEGAPSVSQCLINKDQYGEYEVNINFSNNDQLKRKRGKVWRNFTAKATCKTSEGQSVLRNVSGSAKFSFHKVRGTQTSCDGEIFIRPSNVKVHWNN